MYSAKSVEWTTGIAYFWFLNILDGLTVDLHCIKSKYSVYNAILGAVSTHN